MQTSEYNAAQLKLFYRLEVESAGLVACLASNDSPEIAQDYLAMIKKTLSDIDSLRGDFMKSTGV